MSQNAVLIERLRRFPAQLEAMIAPLSEAELHTPYLEGEWTVAQNVHHLADSHMMAFMRTKWMLSQDDPFLPGYNQAAWAMHPDELGRPVESSLAILRGLHARWSSLFASLSAEDFDRTGRHEERGPIRVQDILISYADHCDAHVDQIQRTLAAKPQ